LIIIIINFISTDLLLTLLHEEHQQQHELQQLLNLCWWNLYWDQEYPETPKLTKTVKSLLTHIIWLNKHNGGINKQDAEYLHSKQQSGWIPSHSPLHRTDGKSLKNSKLTMNIWKTKNKKTNAHRLNNWMQ